MKRVPANKRRGATLPMMAVGMTMMIGAASLCVDVAALYVRKQAHVNGCDAGALAGVHELPDDRAAAEAEAREAAGGNGLSGPIQVTVEFPADNQILVQSVQNQPLFLARIFGQTNAVVGARARAIIGVPNTVRGNFPGGLRPWGIDDDYYSQVQGQPEGTLVSLKMGARSTTGDTDTPGDFYPLRIDPGDIGAARYRERIKYGGYGTYEVGQWLDTEPGNIQGPTRTAVTWLLNKAQSSPWDEQTVTTATMDNPRVVILPVVDWDTAGSGQTGVQVITFAAFYIQSVNGQEIKGYWMQEATFNNGAIDPEDPPAPDGGLRVAQLIE